MTDGNPERLLFTRRTGKNLLTTAVVVFVLVCALSVLAAFGPVRADGDAVFSDPVPGAAMVPVSSMTTLAPSASAGGVGVLVAGVMRDGTRPAVGATVQLLLQPSDEVLTKAPIGTEIPNNIIGSATTSALGASSFPASALTSRVTEPGIYNLKVLYLTGTGESEFNVSREVAQAGARALAVAAPALASDDTLVVLARSSVPSAAAASAAASKSLVGTEMGGCAAYQKSADYDNVIGAIGQGFVPGGDVGLTVSFKSGRRHTTGVGINSNGHLSAMGTSTHESSLELTSNTMTHGETQLFFTGFHWIRETQPAGSCGMRYPNDRFSATAVQDGFARRYSGAPNLTRCGHYFSGSKATFVRNTGHSYAGGVSLGNIAGGNLSSETNYTNESSSVFFSSYSRGYFVCDEGYDSNHQPHGILMGLADHPGNCRIAGPGGVPVGKNPDYTKC